METPAYLTATIIFIILTVFLTGVIIYGVHYALTKTAWNQPRKKMVFRSSVLALLGWLGLLAFLASRNFFSDFSALPPRFVLAIAPPWIVIFFLASLKAFRYLLHQVPVSWLVYLQTFRVVVEVVLWLVFVAQVAPVQMTFEGRNFDILVGLTAPLAAYFWFQRELKVGWGVFWNIFGLGMLLNIVITAILSVPTPFRVFWNEPANTFVTNVPFIWLPGFVVPVALALHIFSLIQLLGRHKANAGVKGLKPLQKVA